MSITTEMVRELREKTGAGILDCKKALIESAGQFEKAVEYLRKLGLAQAAKKAGRATSEGLVEAYIHPGGKIGVLVEVNCETDFVARTDEFKHFVKDIAMQIAAANPLYIRKEDVPQEILEKEKEIYRAQVRASGKPEKVIEKIVEGRLDKFYTEVCLLEQNFIRDTEQNIQDLIKSLIAKIGENISIRRFSRFQLGS